jgi:hypothetical protein
MILLARSRVISGKFAGAAVDGPTMCATGQGRECRGSVEPVSSASES